MTGLRRAATLVLATVLSGCWLQPGFDARNSRANTLESALTTANVATLSEAWSTTTSESGTPLVANGRVFVGGLGADSVTTVAAFNMTTGAASWSAAGDATYPGWGSSIGPTVSGDDVWIGGFPDPAPDFVTNFTAFRLADGTARAELRVNGYASRPVTSGDLVVQTTAAPGLLIVRDRATMAELWTATLAGLNEPTVPVVPVVAGDLIYVSSGLTVHAFPSAGCGLPTCAPIWSVDLSAQSPEVTNEQVTVIAASPSGEALVTVSGVHTDPYTGDSREFGSLRALAPDGTHEWSTSVGRLGSLAVTSAGVFISGYEMVGPEFEPPIAAPYLRAVQDGAVAWYAPVTATATLAVAGDVLYRGQGATVEAYDASGCGTAACAPLTSVTVPGSVVGLSVAAGKLFVSSSGSGGAQLTAFAPND